MATMGDSAAAASIELYVSRVLRRARSDAITALAARIVAALNVHTERFAGICNPTFPRPLPTFAAGLFMAFGVALDEHA